MIWTILTALTIKGHLSAAVEWNYEDFSAWPGICTTSSYQSPINLTTGITNNKDVYMEFINYNKWLPLNSVLTNNGHTLQLIPGEFNRKNIPKVARMQNDAWGYGVVEYNFAQLHFHWGKDNSEGSEHNINGSSYALEMHIVHYKTEYDNITSAIQSDKNDALLTVAVLFEYNRKSKLRRPPGLSKIIKSMRAGSAISKGERRTFQRFSLNHIMPRNRNNFYYYAGSLTTPNCNQVVRWFVLESKLKVWNGDLLKFRELESAEGVPILSNHRPVQFSSTGPMSYGMN